MEVFISYILICIYFLYIDNVENQVNGVPEALEKQNKALSDLTKVVGSLMDRMEGQDSSHDYEKDYDEYDYRTK